MNTITISSEEWKRDHMELLRLRDEVVLLRDKLNLTEQERQFWRDNYLRVTAGTMAGTLADSLVQGMRRVLK